MQKKNHQQILPEIKEQILSKLQVPGCSVAELAKEYNLPRTTIYTWKGKIRDIHIDNKILEPSKFIELSIKDSSKPALEKVSLIFNNFSFSIEGQVTSASLIEIIKILEEQSC